MLVHCVSLLPAEVSSPPLPRMLENDCMSGLGPDAIQASCLPGIMKGRQVAFGTAIQSAAEMLISQVRQDGAQTGRRPSQTASVTWHTS